MLSDMCVWVCPVDSLRNFRIILRVGIICCCFVVVVVVVVVVLVVVMVVVMVVVVVVVVVVTTLYNTRIRTGNFHLYDARTLLTRHDLLTQENIHRDCIGFQSVRDFGNIIIFLASAPARCTA
jgi:hypothetical protein